MLPAITVPAIMVVLVLSVTAVTDIRYFKVYNLLTIPFLLAGIGFHALSGDSGDLVASLQGAGLGFVALLVPYLMGAMGAGDVKIATAIGAWLGPALIVWVLVIGLLATALYSLAALIHQRRVRDAWLHLQIVCLQAGTLGRHLFALEEKETVQQIVRRPDRRRRLIPFSVMLGIGVVTTLALSLLWEA